MSSLVWTSYQHRSLLSEIHRPVEIRQISAELRVGTRTGKRNVHVQGDGLTQPRALWREFASHVDRSVSNVVLKPSLEDIPRQLPYPLSGVDAAAGDDL